MEKKISIALFNNKVELQVDAEHETFLANQEQIAQIFDVDRSVVSKHLKNIFSDGELQENSVCAKIAQTGTDGKTYQVTFYNLDAILSVGYRVNSAKATQFRIWASQILKEYIIKGFAMDDDRLKNGKHFGKDYFKELLERVRSIRASERRIYQQITDIFAECSEDYNPKAPETLEFFATVQNKFHYAITGKTAAEIIFEKADKNEEKMGLTTWKNAPKGRILKSDVTIAKNYLSEVDIKKLERTISGYFDYIENLIEKRMSFNMKDFAESINKFLDFNEFRVLDDKGSVSKQIADKKAEDEYDTFNKTQKIESDFDKMIKKLKNDK